MPLNFGPAPAIVVRERVWLPLAVVKNIDRVRRDLTLANKALAKKRRQGFPDPEGGAIEHYQLFEETQDFIIVPRNYQWQRHVDPRCRVIDLVNRYGSMGPDAVDLVKLGPNERQPFDQSEGYRRLIADLSNGLPVGQRSYVHGRIFVLRCGGGKTAIALKAARALGGRTLWVTVTDALASQARAAITQHLGVPDEKIGHIQAGRRRVVDKRLGKEGELGIAVATLQTLALSDLEPEFFELWDLVIFDEGDMLGTPAFHVVAPKFRGERWLLTATPERADEMERLFELHVGPIVYHHTKLDIVPQCWFLAAAGKPKPVLGGWDPVRHKKRVLLPPTALNLLMDEERCDQLQRETIKALNSGQERTVLVLGDSREGLGFLGQRFKAAGIDCEVVLGGGKKKETQAKIQRPPVVLATTQMFERGIDRVELDTVIAATLTSAPAARWRQIGGRAGRFDPAKPNKKPLIVVMVDKHIDDIRHLGGKLVDMFMHMQVADNGHMITQPWLCRGIAGELLEERRAMQAARAAAARRNR
jgi:hypothetical protein